MKLEIKTFDCYCYPKVFNINGKRGLLVDFGEREDLGSDNPPEYGCGNMQFIPKPPTNEVLKEYHITIEEYNQICEKLKKELSFGWCDWCQ